MLSSLSILQENERKWINRSGANGTGQCKGIGGLECDFLIPAWPVLNYNVEIKDEVTSICHLPGAANVAGDCEVKS